MFEHLIGEDFLLKGISCSAKEVLLDVVGCRFFKLSQVQDFY